MSARDKRVHLTYFVWHSWNITLNRLAQESSLAQYIQRILDRLGYTSSSCEIINIPKMPQYLFAAPSFEEMEDFRRDMRFVANEKRRVEQEADNKKQEIAEAAANVIQDANFPSKISTPILQKRSVGRPEGSGPLQIAAARAAETKAQQLQLAMSQRLAAGIPEPIPAPKKIQYTLEQLASRKRDREDMIGAQAKLATLDADDDILQQMCTGDDNNSVLEAKFELGKQMGAFVPSEVLDLGMMYVQDQVTDVTVREMFSVFSTACTDVGRFLHKVGGRYIVKPVLAMRHYVLVVVDKDDGIVRVYDSCFEKRYFTPRRNELIKLHFKECIHEDTKWHDVPGPQQDYATNDCAFFCILNFAQLCGVESISRIPLNNIRSTQLDLLKAKYCHSSPIPIKKFD